MKLNIIYLLMITLIGIIVSASIAQQNENDPNVGTEVEALKKRVSELEDKLKIVGNVEKMELAAKLAEAQTRLINADFDKLKLELKDSNEKWVWGWIGFLGVIFAILGVMLLSYFRNKVDQFIEIGIEKRIDEFKESIDKVNTLETQVKILNKEHAANFIEQSIRNYYDESYKEMVNRISQDTLLDLFSDNTRDIQIRSKAINELANRKSTGFVSSVLEFLYSTLDSDTYKKAGDKTKIALRSLVHSLGMIHTQEIYDELTKFLDRLLKENIEIKDIFIAPTTFSLADVGGTLNTGSSVSIMKESIPYLGYYRHEHQELENVVRYFNKFEEPQGIKEILKYFGSRNSKIKEVCLNLLEKYDPDFVEEQLAAETTTNTESEETDESEPTT